MLFMYISQDYFFCLGNHLLKASCFSFISSFLGNSFFRYLIIFNPQIIVIKTQINIHILDERYIALTSLK